MPQEEVLSEAFHEIRDPIYRMTGYVSILKTTNPTSDEIAQIISSLFTDVIHSKNIVDSIYDYIKVGR